MRSSFWLSGVGSVLVFGTVVTYSWISANEEFYRFEEEPGGVMIEEIIVTGGRMDYVRSFLFSNCGSWHFVNVGIDFPWEVHVDDSESVYVYIEAGVSRCEEKEDGEVSYVTERLRLSEDVEFELSSPRFYISPSQRIGRSAGTMFPLEFEWQIAPRGKSDGIWRVDFSRLEAALELSSDAVLGLTVNGEPSELEALNRPVDQEVDVYAEIPISSSALNILSVVLVAIGIVLNSPLLVDLWRRRASGGQLED